MTIKRRPSRDQAEQSVRAFLAERCPELENEHIRLYEDGDEGSAPGKCGWAWCTSVHDTTSYVHEDLSIEWYGSTADTDE